MTQALATSYEFTKKICLSIPYHKNSTQYFMIITFPKIMVKFQKMYVKVDLKFPKTSRILVAGASATGKSAYVEKCLLHNKSVFENGVDTVLWFSCLPCSEETRRRLESAGLQVETYQGMEDLEDVLLRQHSAQWWQSHSTVVVLDDLAIGALSSADVARCFSIYAHHLPLAALFLITQTLSITNAKFQQLIFRQLTHVVLTKSRRLKASLQHFGRELYPDYPRFASKVFEDLFSSSTARYDYVCLLTDPDNELVYAHKGIFPGETKTIYSPKN